MIYFIPQYFYICRWRENKNGRQREGEADRQCINKFNNNLAYRY